MTGRERIEAAFSKEGTLEIPAVICYEGIYYRDRWDEVTSCPWWYVRSPKIEEQLEWRHKAIERIGQDWVVLPMHYSRMDRENLEIEERGGGVYLTDRQRKREERLVRPEVAGWSPTGDLESVHPERLAETPREIDGLIPVPRGFDAQAVKKDGRADLAARLLEGPARDLYPVYYIASPFWRLYSLWGFEGMMVMVASRPDLVEYACGRALTLAVRAVAEAAALGAKAIWIEECLTDMVSPAAFERFNAPNLRKMIHAVHAGGMKAIYYYCGNPAGKWDLLFSVGADAISLEESKKGWTVDIEEVVERAKGETAVLGNLDAINLLPNATEKELAREIERQIAAGRRNGGRFIMSLGSPVTPATPVARVRLYCDLARKLGCSGAQEPL